MPTVHEAAEALNNNEYGKEGSRDLFADMKASGIVAVFGSSDDLMEFRGAIHDEVGAYDGGKAYVTSEGLLTNDCDNDNCPHFERAKETSAIINALWCEEDGLSWTYKTSIPHETFLIMEDGEPYCRGIVFALSDVRS